MSKNAKLSRKARLRLSILFFLPPFVLTMSYWIIGLKNSYMGHNDIVDSILSIFPGGFQSYTVLIIISMIFCVIAIYWASLGRRKKLDTTRILMLVIVFMSIFLILFDIAQLA